MTAVVGPEAMVEREPVLDPRVAVIQDPEASREAYEAAFTGIVEEFSNDMYGVAVKYLGDPAEAQDALQNSYEKVITHIGKLGPGNLGGWLKTVAANASLDMLRKKGRRPVSLIEEYKEYVPMEAVSLGRADFASPDTSTIAIRNIQVEEALEVVSRLRPEFRTVFLLWNSGMQYSEIADYLGVPIGTVKSRVNRAKRDLAELVESA